MDLYELQAPLCQESQDSLSQEGVRGWDWDAHAGQTQRQERARHVWEKSAPRNQSVEKPEPAFPALPGGIPLPGRWPGWGWLPGGAGISLMCLQLGERRAGDSGQSWVGKVSKLAEQSWPGCLAQCQHQVLVDDVISVFPNPGAEKMCHGTHQYQWGAFRERAGDL